jgi:ribose transport system substrate-binding protein
MKYSVQYASTFAASAQIPLIDAAIAAHPSVLLVSAADPQALVAPLRQAAAQGIKVITVANSVAQVDFLTSVVQGLNRANGVETADLLAKLAAGRGGDVAYIGYTPGGSAITDARQAGFEAEIKKYPNLHLLTPVIVGAVDAATGASATNAILSAHPHLLGIVGSFVNVSDGMAQVLRERGVAGKVIALQMDADPTGVDYVRTGVLQGLLGETFRNEGQDAVQQAYNALTGKPVTKQVSSPPVVFTQANAAQPSMRQYITGNSC